MNTEKIDFVLTWVDGSDPEWLAQKNKYMAIDKNMAPGDANANHRYRDYGLLRYWFRAVECFTPWVNKVFFITCGQKPDWLNESAPKLRLINHQDYIPSEYLPTFHSNTIELNLHRIPDLSEHFILFNDDMYLLRHLQTDAFFKKGLPVMPCDLGIPRWLGSSNISHIILNNNGLVMRKFNGNTPIWKNAIKFFNIPALGLGRALKNLFSFAINQTVITGTFGHLALPHLKSTLAKVWDIYPEIMNRTSEHKFRHDDCVNQWLLCTWNMMAGDFYPANEKRIGAFIGVNENNLDLVCKIITSASSQQVCIDDRLPEENDEIFNRSVEELAKAFNKILPQKSSFEK